MKHFLRLQLTVLVACAAGIVLPSVAADKPTPIKALLITGGCCHDYDNQKTIIPDGVKAHTTVPVDWTIIHQGGKTVDTEIPFYRTGGWADGFDVVVHNECFAAAGSEEFTELILAPHRAGTPAVLVHCAMHCYRRGPGEKWFKFCGAHSPRHGPHHPFEVQITATDHEITKGLANWTTPKGELYYIKTVYPGTVALAESKSNQTGEMHINIWTHEYGPNKTRVFATTIGHHNETMEDPHYQEMLTRGLLWAAGRPVAESLKSK
jgi:type 1 glutamine amidotransferase